MEADWIKLIISSIGGGVAVKVLDLLHAWFLRRSAKQETAKRFVDNHLDQFLKSSDELVGKLSSLSREDFRSMHDLPAKPYDNNDYVSLLYLIAKLWADIEIIRREGLSVAIAEDERGRQYQTFVNCLQSKHCRLVDRITQRAIGELLIVRHDSGKIETKNFIEFYAMLVEQQSSLLHWFEDLEHVLSRMKHTPDRQLILQYGIVAHAMINTLDPDFKVTNKRPCHSEKLSKKTNRTLKYVIFNHYLSFVENKKEYIKDA